MGREGQENEREGWGREVGRGWGRMEAEGWQDRGWKDKEEKETCSRERQKGSGVSVLRE